MDNQLLDTQVKETAAPSCALVQPSVLIRQLAIAIVGILMGVAIVMFGMHWVEHSDPYVRSVLALEGHVDQGRIIFQMNCATCHGITGDGQVGPNLHHVSSRKSEVGLIRQVTSGKTPPMPQFQPNPQEMADLLQYLKSL